MEFNGFSMKNPGREGVGLKLRKRTRGGRSNKKPIEGMFPTARTSRVLRKEYKN